MKKLAFFLIISLFTMACWFIPEDKSGEKPLAKVANQFLYPSDVAGIGGGLSTEDSLYQLALHINKWVKDELMLSVAEDNVETTDRIERMVRDYKATLIMNKYEEALINQRLDTEVTGQQLADYYGENKEQYQSGISWVRCHFVKVKRETPEIRQLKKWFKSDDGVDFERVKLFCAQNKTVHILNEDLWIEYDKLLKELPPNMISSRHRQRQAVLDRMDDTYQYLLLIFEYRDKEQATPLPQVKEEIRRILMHQRRNQILQDIRKEVYEKAKTEGVFEIY
ncbi:MAG: hypothetical protein MK207_07510 [Saprospiraceae bacterium]|nr:hypothetical protein [Saprospiraceae bacterium]